MSALLDTGFLLAVLDADDDLHPACTTALLAESQPLMPDVILPELAYMLLRERGYPALIQFLQSVQDGELRVVRTTSADLVRCASLLGQYADNRVDFVDCVIVAMAERLAIRTILTVDRRHFRVFRPIHCDCFEVIPAQ
jgi:predicted nucleic acid-binding protein